MINLEYFNYHKHTHKSNVRTIDCIVKPSDYISRARELGHNYYSVVEHGWAGNYIEDYGLCEKEGIQLIYGAELYIVENRFEKDRSNQHIILIAKDKEAFRQLNKIMSESNRTGFYYKNRIDIDLIRQLTPELFYCTSACVAGITSLKFEGNNPVFHAVRKHFKDNFFLEIQSHTHELQRKHNKHMLDLSKKYGIPLIHANDSHYILPEQARDRDLFLRGKNMYYEEEEGFILDYADEKTILNRYREQNIFTDEQVTTAIKNTMILTNCEDLKFNRSIKMPNPFGDVDTKGLFKQTLIEKWNKEKKSIPKDRHKEYIQAIADEYTIVVDTNMQNYFLINERIINKAVNEYGGILTKSGRGSCVGFYINKLLGFTEIDRLQAEVPLYPTRFMSVSRILETKSLPD